MLHMPQPVHYKPGASWPSRASIQRLPLQWSYVDSAEAFTTSHVVSFLITDIGPARSDRYVIFAVATEDEITRSVTIGGTAAKCAARGVTTAQDNCVDVWFARVPTGTTVTIDYETTNLDGADGLCSVAIGVGTIVGAPFLDIVDVSVENNVNGTSTTTNPAGLTSPDILLSAHLVTGGDANTSFSSNFTVVEDVDQPAHGGPYETNLAMGSVIKQAGSEAITCSWTGTRDAAACSAIFRGSKQDPYPLTWATVNHEYEADNQLGISAGAAYNFLNASIGTADPHRYVVVGTYLREDGVTGVPNVASVTVGGVACTKLVERQTDSVDECSVSLWWGLVPTGTTADITIGTDGAGGDPDLGAIGVWSVTTDGSVPFSRDTWANGSLLNQSYDLQSKAGDIIISLTGSRSNGAVRSHNYQGEGSRDFHNQIGALDDRVSGYSVQTLQYDVMFECEISGGVECSATVGVAIAKGGS